MIFCGCSDGPWMHPTGERAEKGKKPAPGLIRGLWTVPGWGKRLTILSTKARSIRTRFPQPLENACFFLRMGLELIDGAFSTLPTTPTTILIHTKGFDGNPVP